MQICRNNLHNQTQTDRRRKSSLKHFAWKISAGTNEKQNVEAFRIPFSTADIAPLFTCSVKMSQSTYLGLDKKYAAAEQMSFLSLIF